MTTSHSTGSRRRLIAAAGALATHALLPAGARAQAGWPSKQLRIVVPFPAGGGADVGARLLAQHLATALGKPVVVENRAGADGAIAALEVARSAPDGHTIFFGTASSMSYVPAVRKAPGYDPIADFAPITYFVTFTFFLMVHESVPGRTLEEVMAHARANPGKLAYGTGNSTGILATAQLMKSAGIDMVHVPYKGEAQALTDFSTGRIQLMFATPALTIPMAKDGKVRAVAVLLPRRSPLMPEVPTMAEAGQPLVDIAPWGGFVAPAKTPREIVERLSREMNLIMARPDLREQMDKYALPMRGSTPDELGAFIRDQLAAFARAARDAKIPVE